MSRLDRLKSYFDNTTPEHHLINLADRGALVGKRPRNELFEKIATDVRRRKPIILFDWFWTHRDVLEFKDGFTSYLSADDVEWYLCKMCDFTKSKTNLHWVERVNLFHTFGLTRLIGNRGSLNILEKNFGYANTKNKKQIRTLLDISAYNAIAMIKYKELKDTIEILAKIRRSLSIIPIYSKYQLFYYGSEDEYFSQMVSNLSNNKIVIVPQSVISLLWIAKSKHNQELYQKTKDIFYTSFPSRVVNVIEKIDNKYLDMSD